MKQRAVTVLKWIGILPCALVAGAIAWLFLYYSNFFFSDSGSWNMHYFVPLECAFVSGGLYMLVGVEMAPAYKKPVAIILLVIIGLIATLAFFGAAMENAYYLIFTFVVGLVGVALGYSIATEKKKEKVEGTITAASSESA